MKPEIHPEYRKVLFHDTTADAYFLIRSTVETERTADYEGATYPYVTIDVSSASHPFYTGKQRISQTDGRIAKFNKRFNRGAKPTEAG
ncbi:MAG: type B 50S ribosomal protein L31 [Pseudomonadota bacterium]